MTGSRRVRAYHTVRTAHLERALELEPADLIYGQRRYDFDACMAANVSDRARLEQAGVLRSAWLLARRGYDAIEINEPIALDTVRRTSLALAAISLADLVRRRRTRVVSYAIGNVPLGELPRPRGKARLGRLLDERLAPLVWRRCDRFVFGTDSARAAYAASFGREGARTTVTTVPALPTVCTCSAPPNQVSAEGAVAQRLLFLGDLSRRKGFDAVVQAWRQVRNRVPEAEFVIVGRGIMIDQARSLARDDDRVVLVEDPPRVVVHSQLRQASVVVLPSQPNRGWREQVGLPLVEGLAHGCTVVTTDETGIAGWLSEHGHHTFSARDVASRLPDAIITALEQPLTRGTVYRSLPLLDGRLEADAWMFSD